MRPRVFLQCSSGKFIPVLAGFLFTAAAWSAGKVEVAAWDVLTHGIAEEQSLKRVHAVAALGTIGARPEVVKLIEGRLADKDSQVRSMAASTLGEMKSRESAPKLQEALHDKAGEVCFAAAKALWDMGDSSGRALLLQVLGRERAASQGIMGSNMADAKRMMQNPSELALMGIKEGASVFGPFGAGISLVEEIKKDRSAPARAMSATLLASDKDPQSLGALEAALKDKSWIVRAAVAKALGSRGNGDSVAKLDPLLKDQKDTVRYMAAASIVRLSQKNAQTKAARLQ